MRHLRLIPHVITVFLCCSQRPCGHDLRLQRICMSCQCIHAFIPLDAFLLRTRAHFGEINQSSQPRHTLLEPATLLNPPVLPTDFADGFVRRTRATLPSLNVIARANGLCSLRIGVRFVASATPG